MELIEIILTTLKLFVLISSIVVLISYFVYKVKDRKRTKPYSEIIHQELSTQPLEIKEDLISNKQMRFQVLNSEDEPAPYNEVGFLTQKQIETKNIPNSPLKYKRKQVNQSFDIYNHYSNSNFEPMHKIKL